MIQKFTIRFLRIFGVFGGFTDCSLRFTVYSLLQNFATNRRNYVLVFLCQKNRTEEQKDIFGLGVSVFTVYSLLQNS